MNRADSRHKADLDEVSRQNPFTNFARGVEERSGSDELFSDFFFTDGAPQISGPATPHVGVAADTGAGHANKAVGGRPALDTRRPVKNGMRIPRGTVVEAEETADLQAFAGRREQQDAFGAPEPAGQPTMHTINSRGGSTGPETVTGGSAVRSSTVCVERNGMPRGGVGPVRGPGGREARKQAQQGGATASRLPGRGRRRTLAHQAPARCAAGRQLGASEDTAHEVRYQPRVERAPLLRTRYGRCAK